MKLMLHLLSLLFFIPIIAQTDATSGDYLNNSSKNNTLKDRITESDMQKIRLEFNAVTGPKTRRELLLGFSDYTSDEFDYAYDAECAESNNNDLNLNLEGKNMNIQAYSPISADKVVPLNFKSSGDNTFEIKIIESEGIKEGQKIFIKDNLTGDYFDLTADVAYSFSSNQGKFNTRFEIVFQSEQQALDIEESLVTENHIYYQNKNNTLFVKKLNSRVSKLLLVNMRGQISLQMDNVPMAALKNGMQFFNMSTGAYLVQLRTEDNEVLTEKIVVN